MNAKGKEPTMTSHHRAITAGAIAAGAFTVGLLACGGAAQAQSLTVLPVSIAMPPGDLATTLTVINQGDAETSVQVRALAWSQPGGVENLAPSDAVVASPPIMTIAPGATQVVRLVLRGAPQGKEETFRILLDQIPPPAAPGMVRIALRLSIPVFAAPATRAVPRLAYHLESDAGKQYLVAVNDGGSHDTLRDITLTTGSGAAVKMASDASPYILAGATRRWRLDETGPASGPLQLKAKSDTGLVDQAVAVAAPH
jgi:fimbrial chaperone protein